MWLAKEFDWNTQWRRFAWYGSIILCGLLLYGLITWALLEGFGQQLEYLPNYVRPDLLTAYPETILRSVACSTAARMFVAVQGVRWQNEPNCRNSAFGRYRLLSACCHPLPMARAYNSGRRPQWPSTVREVVENIEPVNGKVVGYPTPTVGGPGAPSCYRVSLLSGSLEVTARLKSADDLELLVKVLEANKPLFAKADRLAAEVLTLTEESAGSAPSLSSAPDGAEAQA